MNKLCYYCFICAQKSILVALRPTIYIFIYIYIYIRGCNDTRIHIELFSTRLSVRFALQTERFVGLILLCLENKRA